MLGAFVQPGQLYLRPLRVRTTLDPFQQPRRLPLLEPVYFFVPLNSWNFRVCAKASDKETEWG